MITLPNGWYDPVYAREQLRHPFVQIWEARQQQEWEVYQAAHAQAVEEMEVRRAAYAQAVKEKAATAHGRTAYRLAKGYADKRGHTYPHIAAEAADLYLAGGVTYREVGAKYGLSRERIRQIVARVQKKRGVY
jgi:DNA-binding CsgD family transcriptional regulator